MGLRFQIEPRPEYLLVEISGIWDMNDVKAGSSAVLDASAEHKLYKILMDNRKAHGKINLVDRWEYANFMADEILHRIFEGKFPNVSLSYLGDDLIDEKRFGQLVANNRGISLIATRDASEAYSYLGIPFPDSERQ